MTYTNEIGKTFNVKEVNGKFFYFSAKAVRWLPVAKAKVTM
jgi:hypothetical protein